MKDKIIILLALAVVVTNGFIGHFFAPNGINLTPIVLIITTSLIAFGTKELNVIPKSIYAFSFVALNDILIKLYSGGSHDSEGLMWIQGFLYIGLLPSVIILYTAILKNKKEEIVKKIIAIGIFPILVMVYLYFFKNLGLGRYYMI